LDGHGGISGRKVRVRVGQDRSKRGCVGRSHRADDGIERTLNTSSSAAARTTSLAGLAPFTRSPLIAREEVARPTRAVLPEEDRDAAEMHADVRVADVSIVAGMVRIEIRGVPGGMRRQIRR